MRYAMFSREPISFTATNSSSGVSRISFSAARPIRPRPLIATFTAIFFPPSNHNLDRSRFDLPAGDGPAKTVAAHYLTTGGPTLILRRNSGSHGGSMSRNPAPSQVPYERLQCPGIIVFFVLGAEEEHHVPFLGYV